LGKRLILGTKPEVDPLQELSESSSTITTGTEIRWENRVVGRPLAILLFTSFLSIVIGLYVPVSVTIISTLLLIIHLRPVSLVTS